MIRVFVEVREGADPLRVEVRAESISQSVGSIEERHPGRKVQVVFPIDPEEFFVGGAQETGAGREQNARPRSRKGSVGPLRFMATRRRTQDKIKIWAAPSEPSAVLAEC
jgi:hypothetical protein